MVGEREDDQSRKMKTKMKMGKMGMDGLITEYRVKKHDGLILKFNKTEIIEEKLKSGNKSVCTQGPQGLGFRSHMGKEFNDQ